jgi:hypothetical protein
VRIVPSALLLVRQDLVCVLDIGEEGGGALDVAIVAVGVQFERFPAVRLLESTVISRIPGSWVMRSYSSCVAVLSTLSSS